MGGSKSKEAPSMKTGGTTQSTEAQQRDSKFDWGESPTQIDDEEREKMEELVLLTWATCKAKPTPVKMYRSDEEETIRRETVAWRKRLSFIELDCGEDSFFVSNTYKTVGMADGVGGWRDEGIDPSVFANTLMKNAKLYCETHRKEGDPAKIIQQAYDKTVHDGNVSAGGSTALAATLRETKTGKHELDVANLGDAGLIVVRDHEVISRMHEKVHGFNAPFQLSILPDKYKGRCFADSMADCVRETFPVQEGDVVVLGTDGLFDNRWPTQIAADAGWIGQSPTNPYDNVPIIGNVLNMFLAPSHKQGYADPYRITQKLVKDAYKTSVSKDGDSPWSASLREFGVENSEGGKPDDISVMVSLVTTREEAMRATMW